ncbi:lysophospholipid acyltransferase family protein [Haloplasma contractile]|uniref:1-acyl-sn-glycerol-3-phosphate acyltransferase protein n=1 Tax=Haloplasma contractile SSD-17B TaxID=1033810 RepID=U2DZN7_9MOLU|nr:lysophospholipid acyltransferase family protein [Haloplasma contractile]ERJ13667.1 1-acyl-sn-glycerol-3-phosphate acyltransferase protein [Haloplasma contractile SSD-17B]
MKKNKSSKRNDFLSNSLLRAIKRPLKYYIHRKVNLEILKNDAKQDKGPFLIIGNHVNNYDPLVALSLVKPAVKFVASEVTFQSRTARFFMNIIHTIPIAKRNNDIRSVKRLIKEVKMGNSIGIFPEGGRTWDGETDELIHSTVKLIKMLKVPVYAMKLEGGYLSHPRWAKNIRKGTQFVTINKMLEKEQVTTMSEDELFTTMHDTLYLNEYEWQKDRMIPYKGDALAESIEMLLYYCPKCQSIDTIKSKGDEFFCTECHTKGRMNVYGFIEGDFKYDNCVDWNKWQKGKLKEQLEQGYHVNIKLSNVELLYRNRDEVKRNITCDLHFTNDHLSLTISDEEQIIEYKNMNSVSITFRTSFTIYIGHKLYQLKIEPEKHNISIVYLLDLVNYLRGH